MIIHVCFDKNAFNDPTTATVTLPFGCCFTCRLTAISGLVPNGMSLILHGLSLSLVWMVAKVFIATISAYLRKSFSLVLMRW